MRKFLLLFLGIFCTASIIPAQIITPVIRANFGVDADLRANYFNGLVQSGNDDWFRLPLSAGTGGQFVIDTGGAAAILAGYGDDINNCKIPFYRGMRFPAYAVINNRLLIDAYFVRDYHGDDSTIFALGSNKNGMSPADWSCPPSQSIPDKNEILDVMVHVRRAGPTVTDSMWLFGGISIENTTGNRYFDFEMYQTDIYYDRATRQFYNYGPQAGHTAWTFDGSGNMNTPGDIILTAEYSSSSLTMVEARIWVDRSALTSVTPAAFNWTGSFDGATSGSQYGYAGITPKTAGAFYTGLQSVNNTWAGPFALVLGNNSVVPNYTARQYMEFSVNMSKLGLDEAQIFGGDDCDMPFRRVIVKTRASTSFTAELKDFVAPFDFFIAPRAEVETTTPVICDTGSLGGVYVMNPIPTSVYQWTTIGGNIVGTTTGPAITIDRPGTYIVTQALQAACGTYATDTITVGSIGDCGVLANNLINANSVLQGNAVQLSWQAAENQLARNFEIERSTDAVNYVTLTGIPATTASGLASYSYTDDVTALENPAIWYRIKMTEAGNKILYSPVMRQLRSKQFQKPVKISPNPAKENIQLFLQTATTEKANISIFDPQGRKVFAQTALLQAGVTPITINKLTEQHPGLYTVQINLGNQTFTEKVILIK